MSQKFKNIPLVWYWGRLSMMKIRIERRIKIWIVTENTKAILDDWGFSKISHVVLRRRPNVVRVPKMWHDKMGRDEQNTSSSHVLRIQTQAI